MLLTVDLKNVKQKNISNGKSLPKQQQSSKQGGEWRQWWHQLAIGCFPVWQTAKVCSLPPRQSESKSNLTNQRSSGVLWRHLWRERASCTKFRAATNPKRKFSSRSAFPALRQARLPIKKFQSRKILGIREKGRDGTWLYLRKLPRFQRFLFSKYLKSLLRWDYYEIYSTVVSAKLRLISRRSLAEGRKTASYNVWHLLI